MARTIIGIVTSDKNDKTVVVTVKIRKTHPLYRKQYTVSRKFMAHDENNTAQVGDKVSIVESRPLSARKRYSLEKIIEKPLLREDTLVITKDKNEEISRQEHRRTKSDNHKDQKANP